MNGARYTDDHSPPVQDEKILTLAYVISKVEKLMEEVGRIEAYLVDLLLLSVSLPAIKLRSHLEDKI